MKTFIFENDGAIAISSYYEERLTFGAFIEIGFDPSSLWFWAPSLLFFRIPYSALIIWSMNLDPNILMPSGTLSLGCGINVPLSMSPSSYFFLESVKYMSFGMLVIMAS